MDILRSGKYSDFTVILPNKTYKLHKSHLSKCEYFATFFESSLPEANRNELKLEYDDIAFDIFLEYVYDTTKDISSEHLHVLISMASYFRFNELYDKCILSINDITPEGFVDLLIAHVDIVSNMKSTSFTCKRNQAYKLILEKFEIIYDLRLLKRILSSLECTPLYSIIKIISNHKHKVELWEHIKDLNFLINRDEYKKIVKNFPDLLSLPCVTKCVEFSLGWLSLGHVTDSLDFSSDDIDDIIFNRIVRLGNRLPVVLTINENGFMVIENLYLCAQYIIVDIDSGGYIWVDTNKLRINLYPYVGNKSRRYRLIVLSK